MSASARMIAVASLSGLLGLGIGAAAAAPEELPQPTPRVVVVEATPRIVEATPRVVASAECGLLASELYGFASDLAAVLAAIEAAYLDYPEEDIVDFGRRVEDIMWGPEADLPSEADIPDPTACLAESYD